MRNILALVGAATVAFLAVGYYLGWYQVSRKPDATGKQSVQVEINPTKITDDVKRGVEKGSDLVDSLREKPKGDAQAAQPGPATSFFTPTSTPAEVEKGSSGGWKPIGSEPQQAHGEFLGARIPRN